MGGPAPLQMSPSSRELSMAGMAPMGCSGSSLATATSTSAQAP